MYIVLLPPAGYQITVNKYIASYHIKSFPKIYYYRVQPGCFI